MASADITVAANTWTDCGGGGGALFYWTGSDRILIQSGAAGATSTDGVPFSYGGTTPPGTVSWNFAPNMWVYSELPMTIKRLT